MNLLYALALLFILTLIAFGATQSAMLTFALAWVVPYAAFGVFFGGFLYRIFLWAKSPVPFHIPVTCGQGESLPWIRANPVESPAGTAGVLARMFLEVFFFRSLFRNIRMDMTKDRPVYGSAKWLWFFGLLFHWSLFFIVIRHLRFFMEPVPGLITGLSAVDGFFETGIPTLYLSDAAVLCALTFLFLRRVVVPAWRYLSLPADYFALLLIGGIVVTGLWMRHLDPVNLFQIKAMAMGWLALSPSVPKDGGTVFFVHLFLVCTLLVWFPFSKLMHAGGVLLSPTRNLANDSRMRRHVNPWDYPVHVHPYEVYEDDFREKMKAAGLPVEKE